MGPILFFRGAAGETWRLAALVALEDGVEPEPLRPDGGDPVRPSRLGGRAGRSLWRYDFALPAAGGGRGYTLGARRFVVHTPAPGAPLRLAYTACNGIPFETEDDVPPERNERWRHLASEHAKAPFHLLLQGGDQLYADALWREVDDLNGWQDRPPPVRRAAPFAPETAAKVDDYYFNRYVTLLSQPELAHLLASVPSLMMWDDHDIFDGWGSHPDAEQACPVYQGIWRAARETFSLFQLASRPDDLPAGFGDPSGGHFGWAYEVGGVGLIAPDLRSDRSITRVMGAANRRWFDDALESLAGCRHVLLLSSVPLIHADLRPVERTLHGFAKLHGQQDDMRDQWRSVGHEAEWRGLVGHLVDFSARTGARVTVLSGEIHLGAFGVIEGGGVEIAQLTSSGIVSPPPPAPVAALLAFLSRGVTKLGGGLTLRIPPFPGLKGRYLRRRNWMALDVGPKGDLRAAWHAEDAAAVSAVTLPPLAGVERRSAA